MTIRVLAVQPTPEQEASALVQRLQLADLAAGREPVESRTIREVEARREQMRRVTEGVRR
jgi:hypothetical protein